MFNSKLLQLLAPNLIAVFFSLFIGFLTQSWIGWSIFCTTLLIQLFGHLIHYIKLDDWSRHTANNANFEGNGAWDTVFARLYQHERDLHHKIEAANQNAKMFAIAGQAMIDGLISIDNKARIDWCNTSAENMLGLNHPSDVGKTVTNLIRHPSFSAYLNQNDFKHPLSMASPNDTEQRLSIHVVAYGEKRRLIQIRDVTQIERADQMRSDFVANVSHELRTPLTVLAGFVETLRDLDLTLEERQHYLAYMAEQSERMQLILNELLILSNLESAPPPVDERINMSALCHQLLRDAEALSANKHHITLSLKSSVDLLGSQQEIMSAFSNLVTNAVRYTPTGGSIAILWVNNAHGAEFSVTDSGIGIDAKHIPRLTERFYRIDRSRSRETGGTGLGLSIVKHALTRHQASINIQSTLGKGSRFIVQFPISRVVENLI